MSTDASFLTLVCPVTARRARLPADLAAGEIAIEEPEEPIQLPAGWGRLAIEIAVPNPEIEVVERRRAMERANYEATMADPATPEDVKAQLAANFDAALDAQWPLPEHAVVWQRVAFEALSPEALAAGVQALAGAGYPLEVPRG